MDELTRSMDRPAFASLFGREPEVSVSAPGRVNLLGEHTDYNDGYVLPTATPQLTRVEMSRSADDRFRLYAADLDLHVEHRDGEPLPPGFARYVLGCIEVLRHRGHAVPPVNVRIASDVPIGSGLSSSAALEIATLRALRLLLDLPLDDVELALAGQQAEGEYAGVRTGVLDQMASSLCDRDHMLFLDTKTLERRVLPLPAAATLVVLHSGVPRELADTAYNTRRAECEAAARALGVPSLRHVTDPAVAARLPPPLDRRARHVITENNRVLGALHADAVEFGHLMNASHASLRDDYEVSIPALDALVGALQRRPDTFGARLTGAGFGGACVALVRAGSAPSVKADALRDYAALGYAGYALI
jgi:galactokinase